MKDNERLTRQLDIIPLEILATPITIIGAGAIGSWTAKALARMGFEHLTVLDDDKVDTLNLNAQGYKLSDVGVPKVHALATAIADETGIKIESHQARYEGGAFAGIVISAVDNMATRKLVWEEHACSFGTLAVIDPRMGAEQAMLFVAKPGDEHYPKSLYSDDDAVREPCTAKATIYTAYLLSGLVVKAVKDLLTRPDYLKRVDWNIASNDAVLWKAKVESMPEAT